MKPDLRLPALRRFAAAITLLNLVGRTVLGFEQSWAQLFAAILAAYAAEAALEIIDARAGARRPLFLGGWVTAIDFFLPAHITAMACSMLLYANDRIAPMVFAAAAAIASKALLRVKVGRGERHCLNPSNTGIALTLVLFPWVGVAMPYQFTENVAGIWDWVIPGVIVCSGTFLNARFTGKLPLLAGWFGGFIAQAIARSLWFHTPVAAALGPLTGMAFLLFSFYMASDPATTPDEPKRQIGFGAAVAAAYGALQIFHVVYGLFFALFAICALRGAYLYALTAWRAPARAPSPVAAPAHIAAELANR